MYNATKSLEGNAKNKAWRKKAKCKKININLFFSNATEDIEDAKIICNTCPVKTECLNWAVKKAKGQRITNTQNGVLGGATASERMRISAETHLGRYPILCIGCLAFRTPWEEGCQQC